MLCNRLGFKSLCYSFPCGYVLYWGFKTRFLIPGTEPLFRLGIVLGKTEKRFPLFPKFPFPTQIFGGTAGLNSRFPGNIWAFSPKFISLFTLFFPAGFHKNFHPSLGKTISFLETFFGTLPCGLWGAPVKKILPRSMPPGVFTFSPEVVFKNPRVYIVRVVHKRSFVWREAPFWRIQN